MVPFFQRTLRVGPTPRFNLFESYCSTTSSSRSFRGDWGFCPAVRMRKTRFTFCLWPPTLHLIMSHMGQPQNGRLPLEPPLNHHGTHLFVSSRRKLSSKVSFTQKLSSGTSPHHQVPCLAGCYELPQAQRQKDEEVHFAEELQSLREPLGPEVKTCQRA